MYYEEMLFFYCVEVCLNIVWKCCLYIMWKWFKCCVEMYLYIMWICVNVIMLYMYEMKGLCIMQKVFIIYEWSSV